VLYRKTPFIRIVFPICAGIITGLWYKPTLWTGIIFAIILATALIAAARTTRNSIDYFFGLSFTAALFLSGQLLYFIEKENIAILPEKDIRLYATLCDFPEAKEKSYRVVAKMDSVKCQTENRKISGSILLYLEKDSLFSSWQPGDLIGIICKPTLIKNRGNPGEFDYRFYMENQGIRYTSYIRKDRIVSHSEPGTRKLRYRALIIREKIINIFRESGIKGSNLALVAAMTLGDRTMLEPEQKESFMKAGVMHIMAVSGLHAVIISLFVFNVLFFLRGRFNIIRIFAALLVLWAFAFITGLTPSVLRATLMFTFLQSGKLLKRQADSVNCVLASAFVLIILKPSVIFDAGFLLSYSAVLFIIIFYRDLYLKLQPQYWLTDKIWQSLAVTFTAQTGTLPLTIMFFNMFSVYFLITNLIIVPLSSILIVTACLIPLIYSIKTLCIIFIFIVNQLTTAIEFLTAKAASLPGALIEHIGLTLPEGIMIGIFTGLILVKLLKRKSVSMVPILIIFLIFSLSATLRNINLRLSSEFIVYNTPGSANIAIRTGRDLLLINREDTINSAVEHHINSLGLNIHRMEILPGDELVKVKDHKVLIADRVTDVILGKYRPDFVVLTGKNPSADIKYATANPVPVIIISSEASSSHRLIRANQPEYSGKVHSVNISGAFITAL
jgi:competence protein ComEC